MMNVISNFFIRNSNQILLLIFAALIGLLINHCTKIVKTIKLYFKKAFSTISRKIKGQYTLNELMEFEDTPREQLTEKQAKALDKAHKDITDGIENVDFSGFKIKMPPKI